MQPNRDLTLQDPEKLISLGITLANSNMPQDKICAQGARKVPGTVETTALAKHKCDTIGNYAKYVRPKGAWSRGQRTWSE